jgi:hypothetical protein
MTPRTTGRTRACSHADAEARLEVAREYQEVAELVLGEGHVETTVATGNAVLAAIAAADAICCSLAGQMHRGPDHRAAATYLEQVTGNAALASRLRDVVDLEDQSHYGVQSVLLRRARVAVRKSRQLIEAATEHEI